MPTMLDLFQVGPTTMSTMSSGCELRTKVRLGGLIGVCIGSLGGNLQGIYKTHVLFVSFYFAEH